MENLRRLETVAYRPPSRETDPLPEKALVFVHGIFSDHRTFFPLVEGLHSSVPDFADWGKYYFDYNFNNSILHNGNELGLLLHRAFADSRCEVTLIAHSMGGLVCRAALLQTEGIVVRRLIMLGTPNHGTLHTARLGALAHMMRETTGTLWTVFARKSPGIRQLTEIEATFQPVLSRRHIARSSGVDYVSIPGMRFHREGQSTNALGASPGLRGLDVFLSFLRMLPGMNVGLDIPHDGIVEESSVRLSGQPDAFSERPKSHSSQERGSSYVHVIHGDYHEIDHVHVQSAPKTVDLVAGVLLAPDLAAWIQNLTNSQEYNLYP